MRTPYFSDEFCQTCFLSHLQAVILALGIFFSCASNSHAADVVLQVATDEEKQGGPLVELTEAAFARTGYSVKIHYLPWMRALDKSIDGEFDLLLGAYYTTERAELFAYSEPIGKVELCLVKRRDSKIEYSGLADLKPYRIGYIRGATVSPEFDEAARTFLNVEYVAYFEYNIRKLLNKRIDLLIDKKFMIQKTLRERYPESVNEVEILSPPLQTFFFYNAFPRRRTNYQEILAAFNRGLAMIREDGTMAAIYQRHGFNQPPDPLPGNNHYENSGIFSQANQ